MARQEEYQVSFILLDDESDEALFGATVYIEELENGTTTDENGLARFENLPPAAYTFIFRHVGYEPITRTIEIPLTSTGTSGTTQDPGTTQDSGTTQDPGTAQDSRTAQDTRTAPPIEIRMEHEHGHLEEITVSTTRTTRTIQDTPTRVIAITAEEIGEKGNMRPGDIRMLLAESTGIQVQQTSAVTGSSNFRIQGLDGRYTQLLKDGFPLYSGFSGGLSIMQIPPLDLQQVEVVKGANSTLYGGGAIAGLVNLITKRPQKKHELSIFTNLSSSNGADLSVFSSGLMRESSGNRGGQLGYTMFTAYNQSEAYDPSDQGFSAVPEVERLTWNPKVFWTPGADTEIMAGGQLSVERRTGGDMLYLTGEETQNRYFEQHDSHRITTQLAITHRLSDQTEITLKNSFNVFGRSIEIPGFRFDGDQTASFTEIAVMRESQGIRRDEHEDGGEDEHEDEHEHEDGGEHDHEHGDDHGAGHNASRWANSWVAGINLWTDQFDGTTANPTDAKSTIAGVFIQNTTTLTEQFSAETGLRADFVDPASFDKRWFLLPRISLLYRFNPAWSMRLGGGLGYKLPDIFTDEAENRAFRNVLPPDPAQVKAEESAGINGDLNFRTILPGETVLRVNQLFYFTHLDNPIILTRDGNIAQGELTQDSNFAQDSELTQDSDFAQDDNLYRFGNLDGSVRSRGIETNIALIRGPVKLFLGYTYVDARRQEAGQSVQVPMNSPHQASAVLMIEEHGDYRFGLESYYYSPQARNEDSSGEGYTIFGVMVEKTWDWFTVFVNFENLFDTRQTRFETIYTGMREQPSFRDIYAPLEGRYINAGVKITL